MADITLCPVPTDANRADVRLQTPGTCGGAVAAQFAAAIVAIATVAAILTTSIEAAAGVTGTGTVAAALTTEITPAAAVTGTATVAGAFTTEINAAATVTGTGTVAAAFTTSITPAAAVSGVATVAGALTTSITPTAAVSGSATVAGALTTAITTGAAISGSTTLVGTLSDAHCWTSSFESVSDFTTPGFYITTPGVPSGATHGLSTGQVHGGTYSHKGTITGTQNNPGAPTDNHRAYPTVQLHKLPGGGFPTPVMTTLWVWLDAPPIAYGEWWSFMTVARNSEDLNWDPIVVNVGSLADPDTLGCVHLFHVPSYNLKDWTYQRLDLPFPFRQWVKLTLLVDFSAVGGFAQLWQDDVLMSQAPVSGGHGVYEQAHFGLYAYALLTSGDIYNDDLEICQVPVPAPAVPTPPVLILTGGRIPFRPSGVN